jgi:hypothetical protein
MRQALPPIIVAALLAAIVVDVVAAGVRSVTGNSGRVYSAAPAGISMAVPASMKSFPTELLPQ